ncbi:hypothetical protein [Streptomyces katrae]|uniref:hypothetical protein n=1 Tax=Streptomyces katrae TaxID=68223 RepID=UPI0004C0F44E|nr:hypothetical protein [Streptomyces katrae]
MPQNPADGAPLVIRERSTEGKIRYASGKLVEIHDQLIDTATRDHRGTLLGVAMQLDSIADAVKVQEAENDRLRERLRKAERAADLLAANHRAVERVQRRLDAWEQRLPENVRTATVLEVLRSDLDDAS